MQFSKFLVIPNLHILNISPKNQNAENQCPQKAHSEKFSEKAKTNSFHRDTFFYIY